MATTKEAKVIDLLFQRLSAITLPAGVGIAYQGQSFEPDPNNGYLQSQVFFNPPLQININYTRDPIRQGLLQVSAMSSHDESVIDVTELAVTVSEHFPRGLKLGDDSFFVRISGDPQLSGPLQDETRLQVPVTVPWQAFTS